MNAESKYSPYACAFNCVTAAIYNYMRLVLKFEFPLERMYPMKQMLAFQSYEDYLITVPPEAMLRDFLQQCGAELEFPELRDIEDAFLYAQEHLQNKGPLSVNVNLRHDVLEPLPFDNDFWHYQLIIGILENGSFDMYDQFEDEGFVYSRQRLSLAMDTPFNYRFERGLTPFMQVKVLDKAHTARKLSECNQIISDLLIGIENYPLEQNIEHGLSCLSRLARFAHEQPGPESIYRVMNSHQIIIKCRQAIVRYLISLDIDASDVLRTIVPRWMQYKDVLGLSLMRRSVSEFARLRDKYCELIEYEKNTFSCVLQTQQSNTRFKSV